MPYAIERTGSKGTVMNTKTGKEYSKKPIPLASAKKQMRLLNAIEHGFVPLGQKK